MKIASQQELQQIEFNHSSKIGYKGFMQKNFLQKKYYKTIFLLVILLHQIILYVSERIF